MDTLAENGAMGIYYTSNGEARNKELTEAILKQQASIDWQKLGEISGTDGNVIFWNDLNLSDVAGLLFDLATVKGQEYLDISITISAKEHGLLMPDSTGKVQQPGDTYANSFYQYADRQAAVVESNIVSAQVVERRISGLAWMDENQNGIREDSEKLLSGVEVQLYRTTSSYYESGDGVVRTVDGVDLYVAYNVLGSAVKYMETDENGAYSFRYLEDGTYVVLMDGVEKYGLTVKNAGEDDSVDSDADATISAEDTVLENAYITEITLPKLANMYASLMESSHNDAGFTTFASDLTIKKVEEDTGVLLSGAVFVLQDKDGKYLSFADRKLAGKLNELNESCYLTTDENGKATVSGLTAGSYTLSESKAPAGFQKSEQIWKFEVRNTAGNDGWSGAIYVGGKPLQDALTVENKSELTSVSVIKKWEDNNNQDGIRGDMKLHLIGTVTDKDGKSHTITEQDGVIRKGDAAQNFVFENLPAYAYGQPVIYTVSEAELTGYEAEYAKLAGDWKNGYEIIITNTHKSKTVSIPVEKIWNDGDNQDGVRPEKIEVVLTGSDGTVRKAELSKESGWKYCFEDLPYYWNEGVVIAYSLQETAVNGYTDEVIAGEDDYSFTVTNKHIPAVVDVLVKKDWNDNDDQDGIRPDVIHVVLKGSDGSKYETALNRKNGYAWLFTGLPMYFNHGEKIIYTVTELEVEGYECSVAVDETGYLFTLTNTHKSLAKSIQVTKVWDDSDDQDGIRPDEIDVILMGSDGKRYLATLSEKNDWEYTFTGLPVYWNKGQVIEYTLKEVEVDGYESKVVRSEDGNLFFLTNRHEPAATDVSVKKVWKDKDNQDGIRPNKIKVILTGSDGKEYKATLNRDNKFRYVFSDLPVYCDGEKITYTLEEVAVKGYQPKVEAEDEYSFTVTNTHIPDEPEEPEEPTKPEKPSESEKPTEPNKPVETPKTGDETNLSLWLTLAVIGLAGIGTAVVMMKPKKKRK